MDATAIAVDTRPQTATAVPSKGQQGKPTVAPAAISGNGLSGLPEHLKKSLLEKVWLLFRSFGSSSDGTSYASSSARARPCRRCECR